MTQTHDNCIHCFPNICIRQRWCEVFNRTLPDDDMFDCEKWESKKKSKQQ